MPAAGSVYITDPVGPTMPEMVSDGSPLPPPISSTFWPIPIRASSIRPDVNGANISAMSTRYLSQYRAESCHASSVLFCSSEFILVRRKLTRFSPFEQIIPQVKRTLSREWSDWDERHGR